MRLDAYLVENGLMSGRDRAKEKIKNGEVLVNGNACHTPSFSVTGQDRVELIGETYFSRGELKLNRAFDTFGVSCRDKVCLDVGASTGGFTYSLLMHGAREIYAVDVGSGQLRDELRADSRVHNIENYNARNLQLTDIGNELIPFAVMDVSFISQRLLLPAVLGCLREDGDLISLLKPQFECEGKYYKNGIVKDREAHFKALTEVCATLNAMGWHVSDAVLSPIKGGDGNTEYLLHIRKGPQISELKEMFRNIR